ncbi:MAG: hypothetical protein IJF72_03090 [Clostridia bacterium]|nr:hypothetical protein [Clostridia bacterium]
MTKIEKQLKELWGKVGFIVNLSQMVEYNLANILAFDEILREFGARDSMYVLEYNEFAEKANFWYSKLSKKSLGYALIRAKTIKYFTKESETLLSQVIEKRNYVIHKLFKEDLTKKKLDTDPSFYFDELEDIIDLLYSVNNDLIEIFKNQKTEHKCIW